MEDANVKVVGNDTQVLGEDLGKAGKEEVSFATFDKAVKQRKAALEKLTELEQKLSLFEQKEKQIEEEKLFEQGEYKKLLADREKENRRLKEEAEQWKQSAVKREKLHAFQEALGGKLADPRYFSFVNTDAIAVDPETNMIDEASLKATVNEFVQQHGRLVDFGGAKLPNGAPSSSSSRVPSYEEWLTMPYEEKLKHKKSVMDADKTRR